MLKPRLDWLERYLNDPKYNEVFVGYSSPARRKMDSIENGLWVGYRGGKPFFNMKFRLSAPKGKLTQKMYAHLRSVITLFDGMHQTLTGPPLIVIPNALAAGWLRKTSYKFTKIADKDKNKLWLYTDMYQPEFASYDATAMPFSAMRELCLAEGKNIAIKAANHLFYDYSQFDES